MAEPAPGSMLGLVTEGPAFPRMVHALRHLAKSAGLDPALLRAVATVNDRQRRLPLERLTARFGGGLKGLQIGVLGLAFKPGTDDVREAPSLPLIRELVEKGAKVRAYDPKSSTPASEVLPSSVEFVDAAEETAEGAHALILLTEWQEVVGADWEGMAVRMLPAEVPV